MGRVHSAPSRIYVNEFNWSGRTNRADLTIDNNLPVVTCFEDDGDYHVEGQYNSKISLGGFFDPLDDHYDQKMWELIGTGLNNLVGVYFGNLAAQGTIGYEVMAKIPNEARPADTGGAVVLNVDKQACGAIVRSTVLCNESILASGVVSGSNKSLEATISGEVFVAILRVLSVTGGPGSIVVEVEESTDDGAGDAYSNLITFTTATGITSERKTIATATELWKRINITTFTGFTAATIMVAVGKEKQRQ